MKKLSIVFCSVILLISCDKMQTVIDIDLPPHESKLVVNSSNNLASPFKVYVSHSIDPLSNDDFQFYSDASVILYQNSSAVDTLTFVDSSYFYISDISPQQGENYKFIISHPKHNTLNTKSLIAPNAIEIKNVSHTTSNVSGGSQISYIRFDIDDPIESNYYLLRLRAYYSYNTENGSSQVDKESLGFDSTDPSLTNGTQDYDDSYSNKILFDDQLFNGQTKSFELSYENYNEFYDVEDSKIDSIQINLHSVSYDYFEYHKSRVQQNDTQGGAIFGSEPVNVFNSFVNDDGTIQGYGLYSINSKDTFMITH
ncbi:MAG: DUF4249 domain-containing protein [Flavobacteriales bacterium]